MSKLNYILPFALLVCGVANANAGAGTCGNACTGASGGGVAVLLVTLRADLTLLHCDQPGLTQGSKPFLHRASSYIAGRGTR